MSESIDTIMPVDDSKGGTTGVASTVAPAANETHGSQDAYTSTLECTTTLVEEEEEEDKGSCDMPEPKKVAQHDLNEPAIEPHQQQPEPIELNASSSSLDRLFHNQKAQIKYYKIIYRGVVALVSNPELNSNRSGAYVSYGEIIASTKELEVPIIGTEQDDYDIDNDTICSSTILNQTTDCSIAPSTASSSLPLAPTQSYHGGGPPPSSPPRRTRTCRIIQVDDVLTGGFAMDASTTGTSHTHATPRRSNTESNEDNNAIQPPPPPPPTSPSSTAAATSGKSFSSPITRLATTPSKTRRSSHGYLLQTQQSTPIAESIASPPLLCQAGLFYYRVTSSHPLVILTGPCADAPRTKGWVLPGTVQEISLRMGSGMTGLEDGVVHLRLSHRKGWIADRRYIMPAMSYGVGRGRIGSSKAQGPRVEIVMKEVSESVDVSSFHIRDDISLGGTSISSASVSTPASVIRTRRRPRRRRRIGEERQVVGTTRNGVLRNADTSIKSHLAIHSVPEAVTSPVSDVSLLSGMSSIKTVHSSSTANGESDRSCTASSNNSHGTREHPVSLRRNQARPTRFLIRVTAPNGLKILDAPSFQVNSLIRGQNGPSMLPFTRRTVTSSESHSTQSIAHTHKQPSSIFHTMSGSLRHQDASVKSSEARSWTFDASGKTRILSRGALFEASKRMERAEHYTPGSGLIKLADKTGWAIIPTKEELDAQYQMYQGSGIEQENAKAYEEVGNAFTPQDRHSQNASDSKWIRIIQRTGVIVSCAPYSANARTRKPGPNLGIPVPSQTTESQPHFGSMLNNRSEKETDAASVVSSVFLDAFRPSRKQDARLESLAAVGHKLPPIESRATIACGMCVEVEPWEQTQSPEKQSFVRIKGGQGWIPRVINGSPYAANIKAPDFRQGSFWFRVQSTNGVSVRTGPSSRSRSIKSNDGVYFKFECGEYLRASEVLTVHGHADRGDGKCPNPSESFAKLYRNKSSRSALKEGPNLTAPGEWVHVHCNGELFLEECVNPPSIKRDPQGWRFDVAIDSGVKVRKGPSFSAEATSILLRGDSVLVNEQVTVSGDELTWLRLKDGRGWVHCSDDNGTSIMKAHETKKDVSRPLISRLFNSES